MEQQAIWAIGIFLAAYALIISEKINRTIVAMIGGLLVIALGIVDQETALQHIDFNTLGLLIGMMIIVSVTAGRLRVRGGMDREAGEGRARRILVALPLITAIASAFLDNVTTILLMVPSPSASRGGSAFRRCRS